MSRRSPSRQLFPVFSFVLILLACSLVAVGPATSARATTAPRITDVYAVGDASFFGSTGTRTLTEPIVGMAASPSGDGYRSVASDGGIFSFGDARFFGSTGALRLNRPIVGMASTASGNGYWLVASDGGIFAFGDASFYGSTGGLHLNRPIVGMTAGRSGHGYRFVATDGGIFSFGDAPFYGSTAAATLTQPIAGMAATPTGDGYWLAAADGRVFGFGDASKAPTRVPLPVSQHVTGIVARATGQGYWLSAARGPAPNVKGEAAVAWYMSRVGQSVYFGQCELAVENAFGTESRYATAYTDWYAQPVKHTDWQNAPRGALVYWNTGSNGHVAISLGAGLVVSTSVGDRIGVVPVGYFQNPLGWADSPFL